MKSGTDPVTNWSDRASPEAGKRSSARSASEGEGEVQVEMSDPSSFLPGVTIFAIWGRSILFCRVAEMVSFRIWLAGILG